MCEKESALPDVMGSPFEVPADAPDNDESLPRPPGNIEFVAPPDDAGPTASDFRSHRAILKEVGHQLQMEQRTILQTHLVSLQEVLDKHQASIIELLQTHPGYPASQSFGMSSFGSGPVAIPSSGFKSRASERGTLVGRQRSQLMCSRKSSGGHRGDGAFKEKGSTGHRQPSNSAEDVEGESAARLPYNKVLPDSPKASRTASTSPRSLISRINHKQQGLANKIGAETTVAPHMAAMNLSEQPSERESVPCAQNATDCKGSAAEDSPDPDEGRLRSNVLVEKIPSNQNRGMSINMPASPMRDVSKRQMCNHIMKTMSTHGNLASIEARDKRRILWLNRETFCIAVSSAIFLNAIYIGVQTDYLVKQSYSSSAGNDKIWMWPDLVFVLIFAVELVLRCYSAGPHCFFMGRDNLWNRFDFVVVLLSILDFLLEYSGNTPGMSLSIFRTFRLVRIMRLMRVGKVLPIVRHLQIMIYSLYGCVSSFFPALILLTFVMYIFGTILLQGVTDHLGTHSTDSHTAKELIKYFGSMPRTFETLVSAVAGGEDWQLYARPVAESCFISRDIVIEGALHQKQQTINHMVEAFTEADTDNSGSLSFDEFQLYMTDEKVRAYFNALDIDVGCAERIFDLLDEEGDSGGQVDLVEFVEGCLAFKGHARLIDTHVIEEKVNILIDHFESIKHILGMRKSASPADRKQ